MQIVRCYIEIYTKIQYLQSTHLQIFNAFIWIYTPLQIIPKLLDPEAVEKC